MKLPRRQFLHLAAGAAALPITGASGACVSMLNASVEAEPVLPAASVALALRVWLPSDSVELSMLQAPRAGISRRRAERGGAFEQRHRAAVLGRAGHRRRAVL